MKKITSVALLMAIMATTSMSFTPALAITDKSTGGSSRNATKQAAIQLKATQQRYSYVNLDWWEGFNDPTMNAYIEKAILNNHDLKMASSSVNEYYQNVRLQFAHELPTASIGLNTAYTKLPAMMGGETGWNYIAPAMAQYEVDLFLKNRDKTKSVKKLYEAAQLDERAAYISVASAVGTTYINVLKLDKIIGVQEQIVSSRKTIYDLMLLRNKEGLTSTADTVKANKAYVSGSTDLIELKKQREKLLNQLAVLIGESPENSASLTRGSLDKLQFNGNVPKEISSEVITQRPDYQRAEKMVEKAGIDVRVAKKEFLPSISLTGLMLFNAQNFGSLLTTSNALQALAGGISLPLFTGGAKVANLRLKKEQYERILQSYYKTNIVAIGEVNDALSAVRHDEEKLNLTLKQEQLEKKEYGYNEVRYKQGTISKLDLIQNKENLLVMDKLVATQKIECMSSYIGLYKAAGAAI